jgi:hypothetical protein
VPLNVAVKTVQSKLQKSADDLAKDVEQRAERVNKSDKEIEQALAEEVAVQEQLATVSKETENVFDVDGMGFAKATFEIRSHGPTPTELAQAVASASTVDPLPMGTACLPSAQEPCEQAHVARVQRLCPQTTSPQLAPSSDCHGRAFWRLPPDETVTGGSLEHTYLGQCLCSPQHRRGLLRHTGCALAVLCPGTQLKAWEHEVVQQKLDHHVHLSWGWNVGKYRNRSAGCTIFLGRRIKQTQIAKIYDGFPGRSQEELRLAE